jgi:CheY-like chemotaxis protein
VVVGENPSAVEVAVTQLEALGAQPAVVFERSRAIRALTVAAPDVVVVDLGYAPLRSHEILDMLGEVAPFHAGEAKPTPLVVLADPPDLTGLQADAWSPVHVVPHDNQVLLQPALVAAVQAASRLESNAGSLGGASRPAPPRHRRSPLGAWVARRGILAGALAVFTGVGAFWWLLERRGSEAGPPAAQAPSATGAIENGVRGSRDANPSTVLATPLPSPPAMDTSATAPAGAASSPAPRATAPHDTPAHPSPEATPASREPGTSIPAATAESPAPLAEPKLDGAVPSPTVPAISRLPSAGSR